MRKSLLKTLLYAMALAMGVAGSVLSMFDGSRVTPLMGLGVAFLAIAGLVANSPKD